MKHAPLALLITSLLLAGCGKSESGDDANAADANAAAQSSDERAAAKPDKGDADSAWDDKVQAYIRIGNALRDFTVPKNETFADWKAKAAAKVAAGDFKAIRTDSHYFSDSDLKSLREARAMPGKTPELDQATDALLAATERVLPVWNELQDYNKAKRYEDDAGAKGKELLPKYSEGIAQLEQAVVALGEQIDAAAKIAHEKAIARYKAEGKLLEMHTWQAMGSAQKVLESFKSEQDFQDQAKIKQADADIAAMEQSIADLRAEHEKRKASGKKDLPMIDRYDSVAENLTGLAGNYRSARKNPADFNRAMESYNDAFNALNMMAR